MGEQRQESWQKSGAARKWIKPYYIIPLVFLLAVAAVFLLWQTKPKTVINVCLIDKTVPAANDRNVEDISSFYRKHQGFYWILEQQKIVFENGDYYDYKKDYFGPQLDEAGRVVSVRETTGIDYLPDLMYIADTYGSELYNNEVRGLNADDIAVISYAHVGGATVIAEMDMFISLQDETVYSQMAELCGVTPTRWVGRYIYELEDFTDVPEWAPPIYELQEGVEWQFSGPGILLASEEGKIIILEEKTHFESKNLLNIRINEEYEDEFGRCASCNFYNWFELIEANYDTEVIATYTFNVNAVGMEKMREVSKYPRFAAITRKNYEGGAPVYFFAGDFNDYVSKLNYNRFLLAPSAYRAISYDRDGDISNFFWNFYTPLMLKILDDVKRDIEYRKDLRVEKEPAEAYARVAGDSFEVNRGGEWETLPFCAVNLCAVMPGEKKYSRDFYIYRDLIQAAVELGATCVRAGDLLPSEFYRAVYENNLDPKKNPIYVIQTIPPPENLDAADYLTEAGREALAAGVRSAIDATHGTGTAAETALRDKAVYLSDISEYVLGYLIDLDLTRDEAAALIMTGEPYAFMGDWFAARENNVEALYAFLNETALRYTRDTYGHSVPVGAKNIAAALRGTVWAAELPAAYNTAGIAREAETAERYSFSAVSLMPDDPILLGNPSLFEYYQDEAGVFLYGGFVRTVRQALGDGAALADRVGLPVNTNSFDKEPQTNGLTEREQGDGVVRLLRTVAQNGFIGGIVSDLNDDWSAIGEDQYRFTVPTGNKYLWHNLLDSAQTRGILAAEAKPPTETELELNGLDRMQKVSFSVNPAYLYLTVQLRSEVNFDTEQLFIGLDTYERNNGEYLYDEDYFANSLSGMEFIIKFDAKTSAGLYVAESYNRDRENYSSEESYTAAFDFVTQLSYGNFSLTESHFYQTGSTIYLRIPWGLLNFTDPSRKVVVDHPSAIVDGQVMTAVTKGIMFSLLIADKQTKDSASLFPASKESTGYKAFSWHSWETVGYSFRRRESFQALKNYFLSVN